MHEITHEQLAIAKLPNTIPTIDNVVLKPTRGPWSTKAGGVLTVPIGLSFNDMQRLMAYDETELLRTQRDIRGQRVYLNRAIPEGTQGGTEYHRVRYEILSVIEGVIRLELEDLFGRTIALILSATQGVDIPPFILHRYKAIQNNSGLLVVANTEYVQGDELTYDTYSTGYFRRLQERFK